MARVLQREVSIALPTVSSTVGERSTCRAGRGEGDSVAILAQRTASGLSSMAAGSEHSSPTKEKGEDIVIPRSTLNSLPCTRMQKDNTCCKSGRIATDIKENNNRVLYMYIGGSAVDHEQSYLLGSVMISCQVWRWAALVCAAARIVGPTCNNSLGPLNPALVIPMDGEDGDSTMAAHTACQNLCKDAWEQANCQRYNWLLIDHMKERHFDLDREKHESEAVDTQLTMQERDYEVDVKAFLASSHVDRSVCRR